MLLIALTALLLCCRDAARRYIMTSLHQGKSERTKTLGGLRGCDSVCLTDVFLKWPHLFVKCEDRLFPSALKTKSVVTDEPEAEDCVFGRRCWTLLI